MHITSLPNLHYPITVTELLKKPGDQVKQSEPIFRYFYETTVTERQSEYDPNGTQVRRKFPSQFECPYEGTIAQWHIEKNTVLRSKGTSLLDVEEFCTHSVQYGGMCAECGKDMTAVSHVQHTPDSSRAETTFAHLAKGFKISRDEATRMDIEGKRRLTEQRKLSLVVDLDLTIIQATVDPTIGEWMRDPTNPNHDAVKDVRSFQLHDENLGRKVDYYVKLRPGLVDFLQNISQIYELHIYTMGTRQYANEIRHIVDPDTSLFGDRILSRSETPGEDSKNLRKLFPVDTKMCVIIDDRADVWRWSPYLVRVTPYNFFVGIGDINGSFLPKREDIMTSPAVTSAVTPPKIAASPDLPLQDGSDDPADADDSALEQFVSMRTSEDINDFHEKSVAQDEALAAQLNERPLLQQQKMLEEEAAKDGESVIEQNGAEESPSHRGPLLRDDDDELSELERALRLIHNRWYEDYDRQHEDKQPTNGNGTGARRPSTTQALGYIPDVKKIVEPLKISTLRNDRVAFSGVVPTNTPLSESRLGRMVLEMGGLLENKVTRRTSYLVARHGDPTHKMRKAATLSTPIVSVEWLYERYNAWWKSDVPIDQYLIESPGLETDDVSEEDEADEALEVLDAEGSEDEFELDENTLAQLDVDDEDEEDYGDTTDDEALSIKGSNGTAGMGDKKRKRGDESEAESVSGGLLGSKLQRRKRQALSRTSSLNKMATINGAGTGASAEEAAEDGASDLDFDAALDEEMERFGSEEFDE